MEHGGFVVRRYLDYILPVTNVADSVRSRCHAPLPTILLPTSRDHGRGYFIVGYEDDGLLGLHENSWVRIREQRVQNTRRLARGRTNGKQLPRPFQGPPKHNFLQSSKTGYSPWVRSYSISFILILLMYYLQDLVFSQELSH